MLHSPSCPDLHHTSGTGHLYQRRFKSFPIQHDEHFLVVCRYVERNALRAGLVERAEVWRWGSLWRRRQHSEPDPPLLSPWPIPRHADWVERVNAALTDRELQAIRQSVQRGRPYGGETWIEAAVERLNLHSTLRPRGRQRVRFEGE